MDQRQQERLGAASGIVFFILLVLSFVFGPDKPPAFTDSAQKVANYVADNRDQLQAGAALTLLSGPFFLWFLGSLARTLRLAEERGPGRLAAVSFAGGIVALGLAVAGTGLQWAASYHSDLDPSTVRALWDSGVGIFSFALGIGIGTLIGAASVLSLRTGALPRWLAGAGVAIAVLEVVYGTVSMFKETGAFSAADGAIGLIGFLLFGLWVLATSIVLVRRAGAAPAAATGTV
jgi:hypothetical protein